MKKPVIITSFLTLSVFMSVLISCQKQEKDNVPETHQSMSLKSTTATTTICDDCNADINAALDLVGVERVTNIDANSYLDGALIPLFGNHGINIENFNFSSAKLLKMKTSSTEGSILVQNVADNNEYLIIKVGNIETTSMEIIGTRTFKITTNGSTITSVNYAPIDGIGNGTIIDFTPPAEPMWGNPDLLGPKRKGESYSDCVDRNWTNFATDFISLVAQTTNGPVVLAAISIDCMFSATNQ